jgi:hypothetical protein
MTIAVELLFMFVFAHFLSAFLDDASHDLPSFLKFLCFIIPLTLASVARRTDLSSPSQRLSQAGGH